MPWALMPYIIPTFDEIRTRQLRDVRALDADAPADADSDHYVRASATASAVPPHIINSLSLYTLAERPKYNATGKAMFSGRVLSAVRCLMSTR